MIVRPIVCRAFIGRQIELAYLHERRREAAASRGGLVLVAGEAGVGKSRLLRELRTSLGKSRVRVGVGSCLEFARQPYGPILELLRRLDPSFVSLQPALSKYEQFDAIVASFERIAERTSLLVIVEDVHWADGATLEFLTYLAGSVSTMRLLVVVSYRAEEVNGQHPSLPLLTGLRAAHVGRVALAPFSGSELDDFIDDALTGVDLPRVAREAVARASEGNPFFTEELLQNAVERGRSTRSTAGSARLPITIQATVIERLRPLGEDQQAVLAQAAVIGRVFDVALLARSFGKEPAALRPILERACTLQLIEEQDSGTFRFRHALTREAIYANFLSSQVQPLHGKVALALEALTADEPPLERLAHHWRAAGDRIQAAHYAVLAGDAASRVHAHDDAIAHYQFALASNGIDERARPKLLEKLAMRLSIVGDNGAAHAARSRAADAYQLLGDVTAESFARSVAAIEALRAGAGTEVRAPLEAMLQRVPPTERTARNTLHLQLGHLAALFDDAEAARFNLELVDHDAVKATPHEHAVYHAASGLVGYISGDVDVVRRELEAVLEAADGGILTTSIGLLNGGMQLATLGRHEEARERWERALVLTQQQRNRLVEAHVYAYTAFGLLCTGDLRGVRTACGNAARLLTPDAAIGLGQASACGTIAGIALGDDEMIRAWFDERRDMLSESQLTTYAAGHAEILYRRGHIAEAQDLLRRSVGRSVSPRGIFMTMLAVARFGAEADLEGARAMLVAAADAPTELVDRPALDLFDAHVARRHGDPNTATERSRAAAQGFGRLRYPLWEAESLEISGDLDGALEIYRRLGAAGAIRRLTADGDQGPPAPLRPNGQEHELSGRQREIATLVAEGKTNVQIGLELSISHKTVEKSLGATYRKLGIASRAQLATYIAENGVR